jgi:predicted 3-demethylubiquinone-9 3-methyltransferase (glyoxalase superfamily)
MGVLLRRWTGSILACRPWRVQARRGASAVQEIARPLSAGGRPGRPLPEARAQADARARPQQGANTMPIRQKITPFLWFDKNAEEAVAFYVALFEDSRIVSVTRCGESGPGPAGSVLAIDFQLAGQRFSAINGGPQFKFTEAVSLFVDCDTQAEIDRLWEALGAGGQYQACGWLKDRYGLSWQICTAALPRMLQDADPARASRVMQAMMQMIKIDIAQLEAAYEGR